ncbi:MAG TPA: hypothetical protein VFS60_14135, partial [Thermoanaerobaculia bacterium]|nr:hypothetical protein [Thermoanaerobaculia bacterium]
MDEDKAQKLRSFLPASMGAGAGMLVVLLVGRAYLANPFEKTRPDERPLAIDQREDNSIDARLWQDPLRALSDYIESNRAKQPQGNDGAAATEVGGADASATTTSSPQRTSVRRLLDGSAANAGNARTAAIEPDGKVAIIAVPLEGQSTSE